MEEPAAAAHEVIETRIEKIVTGGAGLGRHDGLAVFVPATAPGDRVRAEVTRRRKGFLEARLIELLEAGPGRRPAAEGLGAEEPADEDAGEGGCLLGHLQRPAQLQAKRDIVLDCFQRLGRLDVSGLLIGPAADGDEYGYRNKIRLFAAPTGFYGTLRPGTREVVPLARSVLMPALFNECILPWLRQLPPVEQLVVRLDGRGGFLLQLYGRPNRLRPLKRLLRQGDGGLAVPDGCAGILFNNLPVRGRGYLVIHLAGYKFRVDARSFFQANLQVTESIVAALRGWLADERPAGGLLADLYCGVGLFSLALGDLFDQVLAADADPHAVQDARNNLERDAAARPRTTLREGPAERILGEISAEEWSAGRACCLVDPPRQGLEAAVTAELIRLGPPSLAYLSCDPATLARDVAALVQAGYRLRRLRAFDMFPQTAHVETLALLSRDESAAGRSSPTD